MTAYTVAHAAAATPVVISIPHSGTQVPQAQALLSTAVLANTDWFLPALYQDLLAPFTCIINQTSRYAADPNRAADATAADYRYSAVYATNTFGHALYAAPLSDATRQARLERYYWPYRRALAALLAAKIARFGYVYLLDLHSFAQYPHSSAEPADIVLGTDHDRTCPAPLRAALARRLVAGGFSVADNHPFRGGDIVRHYGLQPRVRALQLELRYHSYLGARAYGEEVVTAYSPACFAQAQRRLAAVPAWLATLPAF